MTNIIILIDFRKKKNNRKFHAHRKRNSVCKNIYLRIPSALHEISDHAFSKKRWICFFLSKAQIFWAIICFLSRQCAEDDTYLVGKIQHISCSTQNLNHKRIRKNHICKQNTSLVSVPLLNDYVRGFAVRVNERI